MEYSLFGAPQPKTLASAKTNPASVSTPSTSREKKSSRTGLDFTKPSASFVTIIVDKEDVKKSFVIHRDLIAHYSPFFKKAFESAFIEGQTQTMRLEDVETEIFGLLAHWLYTGDIKHDTSVSGISHSREEKSSSTATEINDMPDLVPFAKLWTLADRCLMPELQNETMRSICELGGRGGTSCAQKLQDFGEHIFANEDKIAHAELEQWFVDRIITQVHLVSFNTFVDTLPAMVIKRILRGLAARYTCLNGRQGYGWLEAESYFVDLPEQPSKT